MQKTNIHPVIPSDRIVQIDILRGFALFGILMVNVFGYHASFYHFGEFYNSLENPDHVAVFRWMVNLGSDKFIFLFSILFGFGFLMLEDKFRAAGKPFPGFYIRRMLSLGLIGIFHILLFWAGDILLVYSLLGLLLLAIRKLSTKSLLIIVVLSYFFTTWYLVIRNYLPFLPDPMSSLTSLTMNEVAEVYANGDFWEVMQMRVNEYIVFRNINLLYYAPKVFALFICIPTAIDTLPDL